MPPSTYWEQSKDQNEVNFELLNKYGPEEEIYGLSIIIKKKHSAVFEYLWDENGIIWNESHLFPVLELIIKKHWTKGVEEFFGYK